MLSRRELESRHEVFLEQYVTKLNIEAETAASIARTMLLPAAARHLALLLEAQLGELASETSDLIAEFTDAIRELESANLAENQPEELEAHAEYMRDSVDPGDGERPSAPPTSSRRWWPTTCGHCRSTPRSCSSSSDSVLKRHRPHADVGRLPIVSRHAVRNSFSRQRNL